MKYHISREQRFFFDSSHFIEFEEILSQDEHADLLSHVAKSKERRDLSRSDPVINKIVQLPRIAKMAAELTNARFLRFGFDQLITLPLPFHNLSQDACINGLVCGLVLSLKPGDATGILFLPTLDLSLLPLQADENYLLIVWADRGAQYLFQPKDPYTHTLKKLGYVFGDKLQDKWHSVVVR